MAIIIENTHSKVKDIEINEAYGFVLKDGSCVGLISDDNRHLTLLWDDYTIEVKDISLYDSILMISDIVEKLNICDFEDIEKIFADINDFDLTIDY